MSERTWRFKSSHPHCRSPLNERASVVLVLDRTADARTDACGSVRAAVPCRRRRTVAPPRSRIVVARRLVAPVLASPANRAAARRRDSAPWLRSDSADIAMAERCHVRCSSPAWLLAAAVTYTASRLRRASSPSGLTAASATPTGTLRRLIGPRDPPLRPPAMLRESARSRRRDPVAALVGPSAREVYTGVLSACPPRRRSPALMTGCRRAPPAAIAASSPARVRSPGRFDRRRPRAPARPELIA